MDLTLHKRFSDNYNLDLNYTLQFSRTTGSAANTVPADTRCSPSTRISAIMNVSAEAWSGSNARTRANNMLMRLIKVHSFDGQCLLTGTHYRREKSLYRARNIIPSTRNKPTW